MSNRHRERWINDVLRNDMYSRLHTIMCDIEKSKTEREISLLGKTFVQYSSVFPSDKFEDTEFFSESIQVSPEEDFLEIGVGAGITSIVAAINGANVVGVDINVAAVANSQANAILNKIEHRTEFIVSDVFSQVPNKKFDTIYWNVPFCYSEINELNNFEKSVFDYKYQSLENFIRNSKSFLKPNGRLLIGFSNIWGLPDKLLGLLYESGYVNFKIIKQKMVEWNLVKFDLTLYELKNNTL